YGYGYAIELEADTRVEFRTARLANATNSVDTYMTLFDADMNVIAYDDDGGGNNTSLITYEVMESGTYYVIVAGYGANSAGTFIFTATELPPTLNQALNVPGGSLNFTTGEEYPWTAVKRGDRLYAQSGNQYCDDTVSSVFLEAGMLSAGQVISFDWKVSSEGGFDFYQFIVNDVVIEAIDGESDWTTYTYTIPEDGEYSFEWRHVKDESEHSGDDTAYLDNVEIKVPYDVNMDGVFNTGDVAAILRYVIGIYTADQIDMVAADVNGDGFVNSGDAAYLLTIALENI
ncbi:MAG: DVUA0089 family protein, partial [Clostridia bacterium]|nr:DVUA0089 family protein [Clostridia bacterium]